ncbi:LOW QUALITY PROTEIN: hypothetical protein GQ55_6G280400 [Panicum hallii var. hallii]|uniref:Uncharacterized protein n=1 Tax=Panicum hallii var. hallii TaxID=1504633 RepID=A0A2T7DAL2_9POAL|nr:LOW QUALITY PROTEIN: hypothetical protein GQ55_6G280400 [Panicum hallii var. hallii]
MRTDLGVAHSFAPSPAFHSPPAAPPAGLRLPSRQRRSPSPPFASDLVRAQSAHRRYGAGVERRVLGRLHVEPLRIVGVATAYGKEREEDTKVGGFGHCRDLTGSKRSAWLHCCSRICHRRQFQASTSPHPRP